MPIGNYVTPNEKAAYSYDTQIYAKTDSGVELWNVTDYSRTTSNLQSDLFVHKALKRDVFLDRQVRSIDVLRVLRGEKAPKKTVDAVEVDSHVIVLRKVPKNTKDLIAYALCTKHISINSNGTLNIAEVTV